MTAPELFQQAAFIVDYLKKPVVNNSFQRELYHRIVAKCWSDPEFKSQLLADPKAVLTAEGFSLSEGSTIRVIEAAKDEVLFLIPQNAIELSDEQLGSVSGGAYEQRTCWSDSNDFPYYTPPSTTPPPPNLPQGLPPGLTSADIPSLP